MNEVYILDACSLISLLTADHHELEIVEKKEKLNLIWIRERKRK